VPIPRVTWWDLADGIATIVKGTTRAGTVVMNPMHSDDPGEYAVLVGDAATGEFDGWVVIPGPRTDTVRLARGGLQYNQVFLLYGFVTETHARASDGLDARQYAAEKELDALEALALPANQALGITTAGAVVKATLPDEPDGVQGVPAREWSVIFLPNQIRVFVQLC
jgi:hypothetical protein